MEQHDAEFIALQTALDSTMQIQKAYGEAVAKARDILVRELNYTKSEAIYELFGSNIKAMKQALTTWEGLQKMFPEQYGLEMK